MSTEIDFNKLSLEELKKMMTPKQIKFAEEYLIDLNATRAALRSGYSEKNARQSGYENMTKPYIRHYVTKKIDEGIIGDSELIKMMADIAKSSVNDYIKTVKVKRPFEIQRPLIEKIKGKKLQILKNEMYIERANLSEERIEAIRNDISSYKNEIVRLEIDLELNPDATFLDYEEREIDVADLDVIAMAKDKENGRIKTFSHTAQGIKVEMNDSDGMIKTLAQIKGLITNKIDADVKNINVDVEMNPDEMRKIANEILKDI